MEKYNKLIVLVHPLYYYFSFMSPFKLYPEKINKQAEIILKQSLFEYSKQLMKLAKKDPKVFFCLVKPNYQNERRNVVYDETIKSFEDFATKQLGERFVVSRLGESLDKKNRDFLPEKYYSRFQSKIDMIGFGEYKEHCVKDWCRDYIPKELNAKGIQARLTDILCQASVFRELDSVGLKSKFITKSQRRQVQQFKKSTKAKDAHLSSFLKTKSRLK